MCGVALLSGGERSELSFRPVRFEISARHPGRGAKLQLDIQVWPFGEGLGQKI